MEEKISANYLFHYTPKSEFLESIIHNGFYPRYCLETPPYSPIEAAFPMVCFCDIPFYLQSEHINEYGKYGIGLKKEWGFKNGLSPLIYSDENSQSTTLLKNLFNLPEKLQIDPDSDEMNIFLGAVGRLSAYYKKYTGYQNGLPKKFYNEREWRYSPQLSENDFRFYLKKEGFENPKIKECFNRSIAIDDKAILNFEISDVKYIILPNKTIKGEFFDRLLNSSSTRSEFDLNQLENKVVFSEDIIRANSK